MLASSFLVFFTCLASLVSGGWLYRGDLRAPEDITKAGGFHSRGTHEDHEKYEATIFQHVSKTLKRPMRDPYISTSRDLNVAKAKKFSGLKYVYWIDEDEIIENVNNVAEIFADEGKTYHYANEQEFAVEYHIPMAAIKKAFKYVKGDWVEIGLNERGM